MLFPDGIANWNEEKTNKALNAHGVSIIEIRKDFKERKWHVVRPSKYARRITAQTPIRIGGPAAGDRSGPAGVGCAVADWLGGETSKEGFPPHALPAGLARCCIRLP